MTRRCGRQLRAFSRRRPRWGYRQAHQHLLEQGWTINRKRVQRLWREEGLRVPQKRRKRQRVGESTVPGDRLRAERPDHVWAFDFQFDVTDDGRAVKLLYVVDEFTREALAMEAERRIDGDQVVDVLDRIIREQGRRPELVRCDNGPEMTSNALRDWCRFSAGPARRSSSPAARGRTRSWSRSTAASATSCSPSRCSAASPKPR